MVTDEFSLCLKYLNSFYQMNLFSLFSFQAKEEVVDDDAVVSSTNICALCNKQRTNDTALATSG